MARWICTSKNTCRLKRTMVELTDDEVRFAGFACASCKAPLERVKPADFGKYGEAPAPAAPNAAKVPASPIALRITLAGDEQPTLRDLFAMFAFAKTTDGSHIARARSAYGIADAMMEERKVKDFGNGDMDACTCLVEASELCPVHQ